MIEVAYAPGCTVVGDRDPEEFLKATNAAHAADVALVFVGADEQVSIEGLDRKSIDLPGAQNELVSAVYAANSKTVLVISSNSPVAVGWEHQDKLPAVIGGHFLGQMQGRALAEALFGDYNPGGKLSTTWFAKTADLPDLHDYRVMSGRTYMYFTGKPLYPFGHGLSYTTFEYRELQLSAKKLGQGETLTASLSLANTGSRAGDEVVQLYVRASCDAMSAPVPLRQLVNFDRVHLQPGETKEIKLALAYSDRALHFWDEDARAFKLAAGAVELFVGSSSADIRLKATIQMR